MRYKLNLTPTRELVKKYDNLVPFIKQLEIRTRLVIGGLDITRDLKKRYSSYCGSTPGRIKDIGFIYNKLNLSKSLL